MKLIVTLLLLFIVNVEMAIAQSWRSLEMQPMPMKIANNSVCEAIVNGVPYVYSFGGIDSTKIYSGITNRSFKYNTVTDTWDTIPSLPDPMTKIAAAASYVNGIIYIIGGYTVFANGNEVSSVRVHRFDAAADTFLTDGANIPVSIDDQVQAVYKDSLIYVVTGWSNTTNVRNVQVYDTYLDTWAQATQVPFNEYRVFGSTGVILGDTIYYFGGAGRSFNFPATNILRKGAIDPSNPLQINWQFSRPNTSVFSYRPASTIAKNQIFWIGGSSVSYNFNGIAYNGSGGVQPSNWSIVYNPNTNAFSTAPPDTGSFPMDLRGIASINDTVKYIVGGMTNNQQVSNKTYRLEYVNLITGINEGKQLSELLIYPNPSSSYFNLSFKVEGEKQLFLYDSKGSLVLNERLKTSPFQMDVSDLKSGMYFLKVQSEKGVETKKLLVH